jgi:chaperone required for assembly of F1-ATPase
MMRDMLEDAGKHADDGFGRAQKLDKPELPKRFYKDVGVAPIETGFVVTLDGRQTRTPGRLPVVVPVSGIATAMAQEWSAQGEFIDAQTMPMVRLVNSAVESGEGAVAAFRDEIVKYCSGDLMLYRAESPLELVQEQEAVSAYVWNYPSRATGCDLGQAFSRFAG